MPEGKRSINTRERDEKLYWYYKYLQALKGPDFKFLPVYRISELLAEPFCIEPSIAQRRLKHVLKNPPQISQDKFILITIDPAKFDD